MKVLSHESGDLKTSLKIKKVQETRNIFPIEINSHHQPINMAVFSPSGLLFATCGNDGKVFLFNGITYQLINSFQIDSKESAVKFIAFNKTGDKLFGATVDRLFMIDVYRFQDEQIVMSATQEDYRVLDFKLSLGDTQIALVSKFMYGAHDLKPGQQVSHVSVYSMKSIMKAFEPLIKKDEEKVEFDKLKAKTVAAEQSTEELRIIDHEVSLPKPDLQIFSNDVEFTKVALFSDEDHVYLAKKNSNLMKYNVKESCSKAESSVQLKSSQINSLEFSARFEFLIVCCNDSVSLIDPVDLSTVHSFNTKFPVNCAKITPLLYDSQSKYHLVYAGGIPAIEQARQSEGGNEITIYNFATGKAITKLGGSFGNINYLDMFKDGSGLITAGQEGVARVYRFDMSYYKDKEFD